VARKKDAGNSHYKVGRGKPPRKSQFKTGKSGNPKGRPKGARNVANVLNDELNRKIDIRENGVTKTISKHDALWKSIVAKALNGDLKAAQTIVAMNERHAARMPPEPDMTIEATDIELLLKYLPVLIEIANRNGGLHGKNKSR
jgi:hypothetical protein